MIFKDTRVFLILQKSKLRRFLKIFKEKDWPKLLVIGCFLLVAVFLVLATYFLSKGAFLFISHYPQFMESMLFYTLLAWFFLIFLLTLGSSIVSSLKVFFVQDDDHFLLSLPMKPQIIFESRLISLLIFSGWPAIIFGLPLLWAFKKVFEFSLAYFFLSFLALFLIILISNLTASILAMKIISISGRRGKRLVNLLAIITLPLLAWWVSRVLIPPYLVEAFQKLNLNQIDSFLKSLPINSMLFPSTWAVNFIFYWTIDQGLALFNLKIMLIVLGFLTVIIYWLVNKEYFHDLAKARVGHFIAGPQDRMRSISSKKSFPYILQGLKGIFLEKDLLMFSRNQAEILQAGFIFFMILLYFLILGKVPLEKLRENFLYLSVDRLIKMNFIFGAYVLALLALRFVFPLISSEGQAGWFVWSAPFSKKELFWQKLFTGWGFLSLVGLVISIFSTKILKLNTVAMLSQFFVFFVLSLGLVVINLGLGALFPDFKEKNLEKISTSSAGILATALSLVYIFLVNKFLPPSLNSFSVFSFSYLVVWLITLLITFLFSSLSFKKIDKYQF